jgi:hypothetical protein
MCAKRHRSKSRSGDKAAYSEFSKAITYYEQNQLFTFHRAFDLFIEQIDPDPEKWDSERLSMYCCEWFLFDFQLPNGQTPLQEYIAKNPDRLSQKNLEDLRQAEESNFTSEFWVNSVDRHNHLLTLEELATGRIIQVRDVSSTSSLEADAGMMAARLMQQGGVWYFAGNPLYFFPVKPTERMKKMLREASNGEPRIFIECVAQVFSTDDADDIDDDAFSYQRTREPLGDGEAKELLEEVKRDYGNLRRKHSLAIKWQQIKTAIRYEDGSRTPLEAFETLFIQGGEHELEFESEEMLSRLTGIFFDSWNLLPHLSLGNRSPNELLWMCQRIDLEAVARALEYSCDSPLRWYLDPDTMEVSFVEEEMLYLLREYFEKSGGGWDGGDEALKQLIADLDDLVIDYEEEELSKWLEGYQDEIIFIEPLEFFEKFEIAHDFIDEVIDDGQLAACLYGVLEGRGAFHRFKDMLAQHGMLGEYRDFCDEAMRRHALEWAGGQGLLTPARG